MKEVRHGDVANAAPAGAVMDGAAAGAPVSAGVSTSRAEAPGGLEPLLLSPERAAALLDVGLTTLYELIARGHLAAVRIRTKPGTRGSYRIRPQALQDYVNRLDSTRRADRAQLVRVK